MRRERRVDESGGDTGLRGEEVRGGGRFADVDEMEGGAPGDIEDVESVRLRVEDENVGVELRVDR